MNIPPVVFVILVSEIMAFLLGIFGNKISSELTIPPEVLLILIFIFVILQSFVVYFLFQYQNAAKLQISASFRKSVIVFPPSIVLGILVGFLSILLLFSDNNHLNVIYVKVFTYEIIDVIIAIAILYLIRRSNERLVFVTFGIGLAAGISASSMLLLPYHTDPIYTVGGNFLFIGISIVILRSKKFEQYINTVRHALSITGIEN